MCAIWLATAAVACWINWLISVDGCDYNSGGNEASDVTAEGRMVGRAADVGIIGYVELVCGGIVTSTDGAVAVDVDEVGIGCGEVRRQRSYFLHCVKRD